MRMDVSLVNAFHRQAMIQCDYALMWKRAGNDWAASMHFYAAFQEEKKAADMIADTDMEPIRSVLHRSAATLALDCGEIEEAQRLIAAALKGNVPDVIMVEINELVDRIKSLD